MKTKLVLMFFAFFLSSSIFADSPAPTSAKTEAEQQAEYMQFAKQLWESLDRKNGDVKLPNAVATLNLGKEFYYLDPKDTEKVLVKVWGNPDGAGFDTLGMIFPEKMTPFDADAWGVTIRYEEDGHVSDKDADDINYDDLLSQMQDDVKEGNKQRANMGYESIELVGWAAKPYYDKTTHTLHWAKEIKFGSQQINTLNYSIRVLGRKGVLVLNFISSMEQKADIDKTLGSVLTLAKFDKGSGYNDFDPSMDKVAAYGIGALIAGKLAAKAGLFATLLIFLKKFWILLALGVGAIAKKLFGRRNEA